MISVVEGPFQIEISGKRYYQVVLSDGSKRNLRSVTSIGKQIRIESYLDTWEWQQVEQYGIAGHLKNMDILAARGTLVHSLIEKHILGQEVVQTWDIADEDWWKYESFLAWEEKNKPEYIWTEKILYSIKNGYAGRADAKAYVKGRKYILDWKTAKRVQDSHRMQGAAYVYADREMGKDADGTIIIALGAENARGFSESIVESLDLDYYYRGFDLKNQLLNWDSPLPE